MENSSEYSKRKFEGNFQVFRKEFQYINLPEKKSGRNSENKFTGKKEFRLQKEFRKRIPNYQNRKYDVAYRDKKVAGVA